MGRPHFARVAARSRLRLLEFIVQTQLYLARWRTNAINHPKRAVGDSAVGIPVARNIEDVEKVGAKSENLFAPDVEILEKRCVDLAVSGSTLGAVVSATESERSCGAISACPIIHTCPKAALRGRIGTPPVGDGAITNDQRAVLIRATEPKRVERVAIVRAEDCYRESRIEDGGA